jgi:hypothetical protein
MVKNFVRWENFPRAGKKPVEAYRRCPSRADYVLGMRQNSSQQWEAQGARDAKGVDKAINGKPEAQQLEYLRLKIEMRVLGLGWSQFATRWSSKADARIGSKAHLRSLLVDEILPEERAQRRLKTVPAEAQPPQYTAQNLGQVGTMDVDAARIHGHSLLSRAELDAKAEQAVKRREAAEGGACLQRGARGQEGGGAVEVLPQGRQRADADLGVRAHHPRRRDARRAQTGYSNRHTQRRTKRKSKVQRRYSALTITIN